MEQEWDAVRISSPKSLLSLPRCRLQTLDYYAGVDTSEQVGNG